MSDPERAPRVEGEPNDGPSGTRTQGTRIKSPVLCQLS
jgi:hypothetical protein